LGQFIKKTYFSLVFEVYKLCVTSQGALKNMRSINFLTNFFILFLAIEIS